MDSCMDSCEVSAVGEPVLKEGAICDLQPSTRPVAPEWIFSVSNGSISRDRLTLVKKFELCA